MPIAFVFIRMNGEFSVNAAYVLVKVEFPSTTSSTYDNIKLVDLT